MSIRKDGVKFERKSARRGFFFIAALAILEGVFSFLLYLSLAGRIFAPEAAESAAGVPQLMSYQGRLTDSSGNPLGGTGTTYCLRYSLYDAAAGGVKLWPAGTPTNSTANVVDGVFSDQIGRTDTLTYDFFSTSTVYLQVDVNTVTSTCSGSWESLAPRQQIAASGFALTAESVYGDALRTPTTAKVQMGTGAGVASGQTLLSLDVKNMSDSLGGACTDNGALWYNSANTRALICENGTIQPISNSSTTIAGIGVNAAAPVAAGNVVFSNSNNVSFGLNGSTITASAAGGGGGIGAIAASNTTYTSGTVIISGGANVTVGTNGQTITISAAAGGAAPNVSIYLNDPGAGVVSANLGFSNATLALFPLNGGKLFPGNMTLSTLILGLSGNITATSASSSNTQSFSVGFYSLNGSTLSLAFSASTSVGPAAATSNTALSNGPRNLSFHSSQFNVQPSFSQTNYWVGIWQRSSNYAAQASWMGHRFHTSNQRSGNFGISAATATSMKLFPFWGHYSASFSTAMPVSITKGNVVGASAWAGFAPYVLFNNFDSAF